jgi:hypothetical protein
MGSHKVLPRHQLQAGMVVAQRVEDIGGRLLVPSGVVLTSRHLHALEMWGVASVAVGCAEESAAQTVSEQDLAVARERLVPQFSTCDLAHPFLAALLAGCAKRSALERMRGASAQGLAVRQVRAEQGGSDA